jgi:predicted nucleic acid-binding protein
VLPIDRQVGNRWAALVASGHRTGRLLPAIDSLVAATGLAHDLTMVTRNVADFSGTGVLTLNPWESTS